MANADVVVFRGKGNPVQGGGITVVVDAVVDTVVES
jgi:hypothetical protein